MLHSCKTTSFVKKNQQSACLKFAGEPGTTKSFLIQWHATILQGLISGGAKRRTPTDLMQDSRVHECVCSKKRNLCQFRSIFCFLLNNQRVQKKPLNKVHSLSDKLFWWATQTAALFVMLNFQNPTFHIGPNFQKCPKTISIDSTVLLFDYLVLKCNPSETRICFKNSRF